MRVCLCDKMSFLIINTISQMKSSVDTYIKIYIYTCVVCKSFSVDGFHK